MALKIYNTLSREDQIFEPLNPPKVSMYVCGITPYDETHLGHGRAYVVFDVVRRYLKYSGYKVQYIQNITDIDDKIIKRANDLNISIKELTDKYIESYFDVMGKLNVQKADSYPRATEHIKEMITVIEGLVKKGYAYVIDGGVYFEVAKFKEYGKLSKRKLDDLKDGARVAVDERKRAPLDFALWKSAKEGEPSWDSPWGKGRPGWHIECSTMSAKYLGETLDIHGGGLDLIFPHHENEIAQAECYTGKPFARYWIHNGFVNVNSEKMSKSLGNFFTLRDIFAKYDPMLIRFYLLSTHYRSPINFSDIDIENAKGGLDRIWNALSIVRENASCSVSEIGDKRLVAIKESFRKAMDNDFNTAEALASVFKLCDLIFEFKNGDVSDNIWQQTTGLYEELVVNILGLNVQRVISNSIDGPFKKYIQEMDNARLTKNYIVADMIRKSFVDLGYQVMSGANGTSVTGSEADTLKVISRIEASLANTKTSNMNNYNNYDIVIDKIKAILKSSLPLSSYHDDERITFDKRNKEHIFQIFIYRNNFPIAVKDELIDDINKYIDNKRDNYWQDLDRRLTEDISSQINSIKENLKV